MCGSDAIRKRPGMYVGSTGERGLHQLVFEIVGRAVDEVLTGRAGSVAVTLTPDGGVRVADDGPGVRVEAAGETGDGDGPGLEALLTRVMTAAESGGPDAAVMGLAGVGPCVANALSSRLTAEVRRQGTRWVQEYIRGVAVAPPIAMGPATDSGTTITFQPDPDIFGNVECSFTALADRFRDAAFLNRGLDIALTDARFPGGPRAARFRFPGGAGDFVAFLDGRAGEPLHPDVVAFEWEDERMAGTAEVALRWRMSGRGQLRGFANSRHTPDGGTHVLGFLDGAAGAVNAWAREQRLLRAAGGDLGADRVGRGLTAVVSVKLRRPEFEGATRSTLGGAVVRTCVEEGVRQRLGNWLDEHPEQAAAISRHLVGADGN
nr:ATP-binding protein [Streptomyces sp. SID4948]